MKQVMLTSPVPGAVSKYSAHTATSVQQTGCDLQMIARESKQQKLKMISRDEASKIIVKYLSNDGFY
jgi:hypothetical protein